MVMGRSGELAIICLRSPHRMQTLPRRRMNQVSMIEIRHLKTTSRTLIHMETTLKRMIIKVEADRLGMLRPRLSQCERRPLQTRGADSAIYRHIISGAVRIASQRFAFRFMLDIDSFVLCVTFACEQCCLWYVHATSRHASLVCSVPFGLTTLLSQSICTGGRTHHVGSFFMFNDPKDASSPVVQVRPSSFCRTASLASIPSSSHCVHLIRNLRRTTSRRLAPLRRIGRRVVVLQFAGQGVCPATQVAPCMMLLSVLCRGVKRRCSLLY